jgi:hypothetical protein
MIDVDVIDVDTFDQLLDRTRYVVQRRRDLPPRRRSRRNAI